MAKVKCEFCGSFIQDTMSACPQCGAVNENHRRVVDGTPETIEQLKRWYKVNKLPPEEVTLFFIGKDIKEPLASGVYEEYGKFVVYRNKADGTRVVRYEGTDEAYAVNEVYLRLKEEMLNHISVNIGSQTSASKRGNHILKKMSFFFIIFLVIAILPTVLFNLSDIFDMSIDMSIFSDTENGYYVTDSNDIYYTDGAEYENGYEWWFYDQTDDEWELCAVYNIQTKKPEAITKNDYECFDSYFDVLRNLSIESDKFPITDAPEYIDAGHD